MATNSKSTPNKRRLPRLRFSLRTLLLTMLAATVGFGLFNAYVEGYRVQRAAAEAIHQAGGSVVTTTGEPAWLCQLFGEENFQNIVEVDLRDADDPDEYMDHLVRLKHVEVMIVGGLKFKEEHLDRVARLPALTHLILDSTGVTLEIVNSLLVDRDDLSIFLSQRRAIARLKYRHPSPWTSGFKIVNGVGDALTISRSRPSNFLGIGDDALFDIVTGIQMISYRPDDVGDLLCLNTLQGIYMDQFPGDDFNRFLSRLPELKWLCLSLSNVTNAQLRQLRTVPKLNRLQFFMSNISSTGLAHIARITTLESLDLGNTDINASDLLLLHPLSRLTHLDIRKSQIDGNAVAALSKMSKLKELWVPVGSGFVQRDDYVRLCRALPDCTINGVLGAATMRDEALTIEPESLPRDEPLIFPSK